jgi:hypothetical protein
MTSDWQISRPFIIGDIDSMLKFLNYSFFKLLNLHFISLIVIIPINKIRVPKYIGDQPNPRNMIIRKKPSWIHTLWYKHDVQVHNNSKITGLPLTQ